MAARFSKLRRSLLSDVQRVQEGCQAAQKVKKKKKSTWNKGRRGGEPTTWISTVRHFCVASQIKSFLLMYCENMGRDQIASYSED